jgi:hypothetical protein
MEALLKLNDCSVLSEELSVQAGITLQFFDLGFRIDFVGVSFCSTELTTRTGSAEFFPRSGE